MLIAQISDLHVSADGEAVAGRVDTNTLAGRAIDAVLRLDPRPDMVIVTGDLAEHGAEADYGIAQALFTKFPMPVYAVPGNHDRREAMRSALAPGGYLPAQGPLNFLIESRPVRLIGLDSLVEGKPHGALSRETLNFLQVVLDTHDDVPALVMLHHPPFKCGIAHMDRVRLIEGAEELEKILAAHPRVLRLLTGHVHRPVQTLFGGTIGQIAPSVAHQVVLDFDPDAPAQFTLEPPAFLLHRWSETAGFVTHMAYIDPAPGPFDF